jgi:hypothetical protein
MTFYRSLAICLQAGINYQENNPNFIKPGFISRRFIASLPAKFYTIFALPIVHG